MQQAPQAIVQKLETLIERVEAHIGEQCTQMLNNESCDEDESTLADMLDTLEQLHAFRDRFYSTLH